MSTAFVSAMVVLGGAGILEDDRLARGAMMFLDYFALGLLFFVVVTLFYAIIAIHDVPYEIAKRRQHPHQDAIHAAGWVSLFTLHALWPFLWVWSMAYRPERGWGFSGAPDGQSPAELQATICRLEARIAELEQRSGEPG